MDGEGNLYYYYMVRFLRLSIEVIKVIWTLKLYVRFFKMTGI